MKHYGSPHRNLLRMAQVAVASAAFVMLAACGGGDDNNNASTPAGGIKLQVVSFGDSLSDTGTYSPVIQANFGGGRFTTNPGEVWTQKIAEYYGGTLTPAYLGGFGKPLAASTGLGYAQGGSRITDPNGIGHAPAGMPDYAQATTVPVQTQIQQYIAANGSFNANQLVLVNGGANDIFYQATAAGAAIAAGADPVATQQNTAQQVGLAAQQLANSVAQIIQAGATHVVLINLPNLGSTPQAIATGAQTTLTGLAGLFNKTLAGTLAALQVDPAKLIQIDTYTWQDNLLANYQANGFTVSNTDTACNLKAMVAAATAFGAPSPSAFGTALFCSPQTYTVQNADQTYIFADSVHPSTKVHAMFAQYVETQIAATGLGK
ncbi:SGNH/GDSL hydrolase family protein [Paraburkholderia bonniea]|uniref:SGNH/GDSL hydrolase family protein n=1 Tax=Paraburkholderia bonniea TaxID=2152891 RepID=UPI0012924BEC|nr:SGNH/GDSL hydrolase family protein [Paraburkholderia bonniea]WJF89716.1 SGNH/GDSL hydrolase family protein [Paraburkholderia bonniea]WJF93030.1 SGNH/GDSL hydrolase family protein [Paraburkholderia bonniea]